MTDRSPHPNPRTAENGVIQHLRNQGPATSQELPRNPNLRDKRWVGIVDITRAGTGSSKSRGRTRAIYYLYGDERRAVRKYIDVNTEFVRSCMNDKTNPINMGLEDYWWRMFCEEWIWEGREDEPTGDGGNAGSEPVEKVTKK